MAMGVAGLLDPLCEAGGLGLADVHLPGRKPDHLAAGQDESDAALPLRRDVLVVGLCALDAYVLDEARPPEPARDHAVGPDADRRRREGEREDVRQERGDHREDDRRALEHRRREEQGGEEHE